MRTVAAERHKRFFPGNRRPVGIINVSEELVAQLFANVTTTQRKPATNEAPSFGVRAWAHRVLVVPSWNKYKNIESCFHKLVLI